MGETKCFTINLIIIQQLVNIGSFDLELMQFKTFYTKCLGGYKNI